MKSTTFLVVLFVCVTVSMAVKPRKKCMKLPKIQEKLNQLMENVLCTQKEIWSSCTEDGKITKSYELEDSSDSACQVKDPETMPCKETMDQKKGKCTISKTRDYSGCSSPEGMITIITTDSCKQSTKTIEKPCVSSGNDMTGRLAMKKKKKAEKKMRWMELLKFKVMHLNLTCNYDCEYEKKAQCDMDTMTMKLQKVSGDDAVCVAELEKPCRAKRFRKNKLNKMNKMKGNPKKEAKRKARKQAKKNGKMDRKKARQEKRRQGQECKYRKGVWSECDLQTGNQSMHRSLKRGDPSSCQAVLVIERPCPEKKRKSVCKYRRTQWSECDGVTNVKRMRMTLKRGKPDQCDAIKTIEKICKRKHRGLRGSGCKYIRGTWSECDLTTGKQTMQRPLKPGSQPMCPASKIVQRPCKKKAMKRAGTCKYRKNGRWSPCDITKNTKSRNMILVRGNPQACALKKVLTKPCRQRSKNKGKCKYDKSQWGPCDAATNTVTRTLTLKDGDPTLCNTTRIDVRKCKDKHLRPHVCKYRRTNWGECDSATNTKKMVKTLKRGDPSLCVQVQVIEKKCKKKNKGNVCKYRFQPWSACINATNTMTRRQVLESGPSTCTPVKEYTKKCKKSCIFDNGEWSTCDPVSRQMTRVDILKPGSADYCNSTRVLSKKCGKREKRCIYSFGEWSECDESDNPKRSRVQTLVSGGDNCDQRKITRKPCNKPNGEVRCFFGPWQEYGECKNGVQKKHRQVLQGGLECERKGVKMKSC